MSGLSSQSDPSAQQPDLTDRRLGDYQVLRRLGRGAMAEVYLAEQTSLRRQVALKVLRSDLARDETYVKRFHNEAQAAAALTHANIVQIFEVGEHEGLHFIAQEYVPGRNLGEVIHRNGPPDVKLAVAIMRQCAAALHRAGQQGIVHRDIKPENIMLSPSGEVKVADFGLARVQGGDGVDLTQVGVTMGTPLYMAPEQIEGKPLDPRADLYAFGVTCFHMLSGQAPFSGDTALAVAVQHLNNPPPRLEELRSDLPSGLCRIVHKMMAKKPDERYASARDLLADLRALQIEGLEGEWSEGLDDWSAAEMVALSAARTEATQRLDAVMKTSALVMPRPWPWRKFALAAAGCLVAGVLLAFAVRPRPLLAGADTAPIPERGSAWAQLYHAKMTDSPRAWQSVWENFPGDQYAVQLAKQGLARHYLWQTGQYEQALPLLEELAAVGNLNLSLSAFGIAGKSIVLGLRGDGQQAGEEFARLTPEMIDQLDQRTRQMLGEVISRTRAATGRDAARKLEQLQRDLPLFDDPSRG